MKTKSDLERDLRVDAEGEVVVNDVERQVVFAAVVRRRTLLAPVHLQRPPVHLERVGRLQVRQDLRNGLVDVAAAPAWNVEVKRMNLLQVCLLYSD